MQLHTFSAAAVSELPYCSLKKTDAAIVTIQLYVFYQAVNALECRMVAGIRKDCQLRGLIENDFSLEIGKSERNCPAVVSVGRIANQSGTWESCLLDNHSVFGLKTKKITGKRPKKQQQLLLRYWRCRAKNEVSGVSVQVSATGIDLRSGFLPETRNLTPRPGWASI